MRIDTRHYSEHDDQIEIETVEIAGKLTTVITIHQDIITEWYDEDLDRVIIHIEDESHTKFL